MPAYTVREYGKLAYGKNNGQIDKCHADRLAGMATRSAFALRNGNGVFEHGRHALHARGVVGIVAAGNVSLEILPKIDVDCGESADHRNAAIRKNLVHMLSVALNLKIDLGAVTDLAWQRETLLEILIRFFCNKLSAALRKGMPRRYAEREEDLPALRGKLDITRQFIRHAVNPSRLACRFDLLSENIALNRIMKAAVLHLLHLSRRSSNQQSLRELAFVYADIADAPIAALRWDEVIIDRTNRPWQELLAMARLFLQDRYQATTGGGSQGIAMLFEMNTLFEEYIGRMIVRALTEPGITVLLQGGHLYCLSAQDRERRLFRTKPDILIRDNSKVIHIIDTKWKRIASRIDDPKQGVSQADVYQMMAYAQLYSAPRLTLLYPHHRGLGAKEAVHTRHCITGHTAFLETASIDVANTTDMPGRLRRLFLPASPPIPS